MTAPTVRAGRTWPGLLPPDRRFVALPSTARPRVVVERHAAAMDHVRRSLVTVPAGSPVPSWLVPVLGWGLRVPAVRCLLPGPDPAVEAVSGTLLPRLARAAGPLVVLDHSRDADPCTQVLEIDPERAVPTTAAKVAGGPRSAARVRREADRLAALADRLGAWEGTVPRLLGLEEHGGHPAVVTTGLPGVPVIVRAHRWRGLRDRRAVAADLLAAGRWLVSFWRATRRGRGPLTRAATAGEAVLDMPDGVREAAAAVHVRLARHGAPRTAVHGDFWPGNVLVERGIVTGVVDWERAEDAGSPVRDLARFVLGYSTYLDRHTPPGRAVAGHPGLRAGHPGAPLTYALDGSGWYPDLVRGVLGEGLRTLGLPEHLGRDAVLAELLAVAAEADDPVFAGRQLDGFALLAGGPP